MNDGIGVGGLVTGYRLYMATGPTSSYTLIYDGKGYPKVSTKIVYNLSTGQMYRFKVSSLNFNGEGSLSSEFLTYACIAPYNMAAPTRVTSTLTSLTLAWQAPEDDGGCPITGYAVFRDNGDD